MVVRAQMRWRWQVTLAFGVLGALALANYHLRWQGVVLGALALVPIVFANRMRLAVDASGVTVVNLLRRRRIPWADIRDFRTGSPYRYGPPVLEVCTGDGHRFPAWAVRLGGPTALSSARQDEVLTELRERLILANGVSMDRLDALAVEDALDAADRGEFAQALNLVHEGRVTPEVMAAKLVERGQKDPY